MTAPTHILTGLASVVVVGRVSGVTPDAVGLLALIVGTLAPDIDGNGAITRPGTILRELIGRGLATLIDAVFEFIAAIIGTIFGHRGLFIHLRLRYASSGAGTSGTSRGSCGLAAAMLRIFWAMRLPMLAFLCSVHFHRSGSLLAKWKPVPLPNSF